MKDLQLSSRRNPPRHARKRGIKHWRLGKEQPPPPRFPFSLNGPWPAVVHESTHAKYCTCRFSRHEQKSRNKLTGKVEKTRGGKPGGSNVLFSKFAFHISKRKFDGLVVFCNDVRPSCPCAPFRVMCGLGKHSPCRSAWCSLRNSDTEETSCFNEGSLDHQGNATNNIPPDPVTGTRFLNRERNIRKSQTLF